MRFYVEYNYIQECHMEKDGDVWEWNEEMIEQVEVQESCLCVVMNEFFLRDGWNFYIHPM